ncbi:hypothetical protein HMPREF1624_00741 [Sporothrix schenckii ATCC 58251]|uniref:RBR-type E3 ubiquitin transferase n=1 Tax=Sporothrix schenckii (strain ATCC 58251 / de Perez 2211183) TaxID=1391915 RepID=U7Q3P7_SPOS1|nr:hypothetical protein HMPREF1624_00741 [Sporothrix schenckii ATCC 58251]
MEDTRVYDLCIVTDATASMGIYLHALNDSLPEIIRISALTGCFSRIGIVAYRDYCGGALTEWSGWHGLDARADLDHVPSNAKATRTQLLDFARNLQASHGGDWPEAAKTGLARMYANMRDHVGTVVVVFADAPPHTPATGGVNRIRETDTLTSKAPATASLYGPQAAAFADWVTLARTLCTGRKQARVFSIVQSDHVDTLAPFTYLSARTGGACFEIPSRCGAAAIGQVTMGVLLTWMGVEKKETGGAKAGSAAHLAKYCRYRDTVHLDKLSGERDPEAKKYWVYEDTPDVSKWSRDNLEKIGVGLADLKQHVAARKPALADFSQRYRADEAYRGLVVTNLQDIIKTDVAAITVNPVFGSLWRTVCGDRLNPARDDLLAQFGRQVDATTDADKKARLKQWLEESYDYEAEILELVASVPAADQFPCVLLDPTVDFAKLTTAGGDANGDEDEADNDNDAPVSLTRGDLLEIGRSCDARILRRLGRVLARLTYVATEDDLPGHIAAMTARPGDPGYVPRIPLALARPRHQRKFWKVLLHTIVPGTLLGPRPAALLAALSLRMGLAPLRDVADRELLAFAPHWNTLDVPETWNTNCLNLLLSADQDYVARQAAGTTAPTDGATGLLRSADRALFQALVDYKLAEINLDTTLTARIGWQPDKTKVPMGPTVVCRVCHFPRSVTIMAAQGICGLCDKTACTCATPAIHDACVAAHVSAADTAATPLWWVECSVRACRSQYVIYNPDSLAVRPKCHYCRAAGTQANDAAAVTQAPFVECRTCLSRVIWPAAYRPPGFSAKAFECPACATGAVATVVDVATSARQLVDENGREWLLRNTGGKILEPFSGRSLFYTISTAGVQGFAAAVEVLPPPPPQYSKGHGTLALALHGKAVRNVDDVVAELRRWITARRAEADACSLCFAAASKRSLRAACGRRGCGQRICAGCHSDWYGLNARGRLLNVAALHCPFCRRRPAPAVVARFGLNTLGNLRTAVARAGTWIYAWCNDCGLAQPFAERVCAQGAPPDVVDWQCADCEAKAAEATRRKDAAPAHRFKPCPGCGTVTEKRGGCDHISCPVPGCHTHWCFYCGAQVDPHLIYKHMEKQHGGWYGGAQLANDDPDDYDELEPDGFGECDCVLG